MRFVCVFALPWLCLAAADLYVSPGGNDAWSGKLPAPNVAHSDGPFASVARAQAALRELRKEHPDQPRTVLLRGGTYYLPLSPTAPGTLTFTAFDAGTPRGPITWQNYPGETPIISGGVPVGKGWKHASGFAVAGATSGADEARLSISFITARKPASSDRAPRVRFRGGLLYARRIVLLDG